MDLEVFLTDGSDDATTAAPDPPQLKRFAYAGCAVVGVVSEVDELVFEHPEQGWRKPAPGDVVYDPGRRRVFRRAVDRWRQLELPPLADALDRQLLTHSHRRDM